MLFLGFYSIFFHGGIPGFIGQDWNNWSPIASLNTLQLFTICFPRWEKNSRKRKYYDCIDDEFNIRGNLLPLVPTYCADSFH
jgi:hypothetical protein